MVVAERSYDAEVDDVWDTLTNPERIPRWFLPISGDLRVGGRYQLEGQAGGTITACEPPRHLAVTWEYDGEVSWVDVHLSAASDGTTLRLEHIAHVDDKKWDEYGPGAVGVGWDLTIVALAEHLETGEQVVPDLSNCRRARLHARQQRRLVPSIDRSGHTGGGGNGRGCAHRQRPDTGG